MGVRAETLTLGGGRRTGAPSTGSDIADVRSSSSAPSVPSLAQGVELLGGFEQSGHRVSQSLVRRVDGQMVQVTPVLYAVLDAIDGQRDHQQLAVAVTEKLGKLVEAEDIDFLISKKLQPLGLLRGIDGAEPATRRANPLLALRFRAVITNPKVTSAISAIFSPLFATPIVVAVSLAFLAVNGWLLFNHGVAAATRNALYEPQLLLLVFALTTLSAGFHELGHAAAARYSGARPGVMGVGLYLVWPAFYTDVTDSYRLDRRGRLRVDTGGIYFNAIFAVITYGLWRITGSEALLIVIPLQGLQMLRQLVPLVRLDGYHILADITGVPDLFAHIKPILRSMLPTRWGKGDARALKPWVRFVVTAWVVLVVPILLGTLALLVFTLPRILATAWDSALQSAGDFRAAAGNEEPARAALAVLSIFALAIPALSTIYLVTRIARRSGTKVWRSTEGRPVRRGLTLLVGAALIAAIVMAWWPRGQYTPIQEHERGTLSALTDEPQVVREQPVLLATEPASMTLPSVVDDGELAAPATYELVDLGPEGEVLSSTVFATSVDERARFPFPLPPPPGVGDNQALVVNTIDGSSMIDLALSLVFVDGETVDNRNEAFAFASCTRCSTVAIAFQVVIIIDGHHIVIPENVAAAINAECAVCITHALATQLIGTSFEPLTDAQMAQLQALWSQLEELDVAAAPMSLEDVYAELDAIQKEIETLLVDSGVIEETPETVTAQDEISATEQEPVLEGPVETVPTEEPAPVEEEEAAEPSASPSPSSSSSPSSEPSPSPSDSP